MTKNRQSIVRNGSLVVVAVLGAACHGEATRTTTGGEVEVTAQSLTTVDIDRVLGFEATTVLDWSIIQSGPGALSVSTTASQGSRSLAVASHGYVPVQSVALPSLGSRVGSVIHYDIMLPSQLKQVSPSYYGATQLYLNSPSLGLNNAYLGQVELTPLPVGQWSTVTFTPTSSVLTKLRGTYTDLRATIVVNAPYNATQPYLLDNIRFSDSTLALVTVVDGSGHSISGLTVVAYNGSTPTSNTGLTDSTGLAKVWLPPGSYRFGVTEAGVATYSSATNQCRVPGICTAVTITDKCHNVVCSAQDQCHSVGICDPNAGLCSSPRKADGVACNDGNHCTKNDVCTAGMCGGTAYTCDDSLACTADTCNGDGTCTHTVTPGSCVIGGICYASGAANQTNVCQVCNPAQATTWSNQADGTSCNDGNACTQTDACVAGTCTGGNPVKCVASDQCHDVGTCDPVAGTCSNPLKNDVTSCTTTGQMGPTGGTVTHPSGIGLVVPANAFSQNVHVGVTSVPTSSLNLTGLPNTVPLLGVLSITFPTPPSLPVEVFMPAPASSTGYSGFLVAQVLTLGGTIRLAVVDSASISGGRLTSNCPPFQGIIDSGTYAFLAIPSSVSLAMFRTLNAAGTALEGATVEVVGAVPSFVGISATDGFTLLPVPVPTPSPTTVVIATQSKPCADAQQVIAAISAGKLTPLPLPTIPNLLANQTTNLILQTLGVDPNTIPELPVPCQTAISVVPSAIPETPAAPFKEGDTQQLHVFCTEGTTSECTTAGMSTRDILNMPMTGYEMIFTNYKPLGIPLSPSGTGPAPVTVGNSQTDAGLVTAILPGFGNVQVAVDTICMRKVEAPNCPPVIVTERSESGQLVPVQVVAGEADLAVSGLATPGPDPVSVGSTVAYQFSIINLGPASATSTEAHLVLPGTIATTSAPIYSVASGGASFPCTTQGSDVICKIGALLANDTAVIEGGGTAQAPGAASVSCDVSTTRHDPDPTDNHATVNWIFACQVGTQWDSTTQQCLPCPPSTPAWNSVTQQCEPCPSVTPLWNPATQQCEACPPGTPAWNPATQKCECAPTSCAAAGASCGNIPDGCGGTLNCGPCAVHDGGASDAGTAPDSNMSPDSGGAGDAPSPPPKAFFAIATNYNMPINSNTMSSTELSFATGSSGWGLSLSSVVTANSITTTQAMINNYCGPPSNGVSGQSTLQTYVEGPPGSAFSLAYDWTESVSAESYAGLGGEMAAETVYSSFGTIAADAKAGQGDGKTTSGHGSVSGVTSGGTIVTAGVTYSLATEYTLSAVVVAQGCYYCDTPPGCCSCGEATTTETVTVTVF